MCAQLDLEVMRKRPKERKKDHLIFINFWSKEVHNKKHPKKKTLMFECYNLLNSKE
jgi:hypothetical protein